MNKQLLLIVAVAAIAMAGGYNRGNKIVLDKTNQNVLNFACGGTDDTGNAKLINNDYTYSFKGCPTWLKPNGAQLVGTAPAGTTGSWQVTVSYAAKVGTTKGSSTFYLCFPDSASKIPAATHASVYYVNGAIQGTGFSTAKSGNYVVLMPFLTGGAVFGTVKNTATGGQNCATIQSSLTAAQKKKTDLQTQQDTNNKQYADLDAKITSLKSQQKTLQDQIGATGTDAIDAQITTLQKTIDGLETKLITEKNAADSAAAAVTQDQGFLDAANANKQTVIDKQTQYNSNKAKIDAAKAAWDDATTKATAAQDAVAAAQSTFDQANSASTSASQTLAAANAKVADLQAQLNQAIKEQQAAQAQVDAAAQAIPDAKSKLDSANANLAAAEDNAASAKKAYDDASSGFTVIDFTAELAKADQDIANAQSQLESSKTANDQAQTKYTSTQTTYTSSKSQLTELQNKRDAILTKAGGLNAKLAKLSQNMCDAGHSYNALTLTIASVKTKLSQVDFSIAKWTLKLKTCQQQATQGTIVGDATCGGATTASGSAPTGTNGTGTVSYVGVDYVVVNGVKIYLGSCSSKVYKSGNKNFKVNDTVDFEIVQSSAGKVWGKKVACK